jgi:hypothetical protein
MISDTDSPDENGSSDSGDEPPAKRRTVGIESRRERYTEALYSACIANDTAVVKAILDACPCLVNSDQLHAAVYSGSLGAVECFLERGVLVDARNEFQDTPLYTAVRCRGDRTAMTRLLLDHGADVNARDVGNSTPLIAAVLFDCPLETVALLILRGADVCACDNQDRTPLHHSLMGHAADYACYHAQEAKYHLAITELLLKAGADANAHQELVSTTPLFGARTPEMASLLLTGGADPDALDKFGRPALPRGKFPGVADEFIRIASTFAHAQHPRLGVASPAGLIAGFGWVTEYIVRIALPRWPGDTEPVLR